MNWGTPHPFCHAGSWLFERNKNLFQKTKTTGR